MPGRVKRHRPLHGAFLGFEPLDANFLYCPNQFFDVALPHLSRGGLRLIGYLLRRTLGWLDHKGQPIEEDVAVTYEDLVSHAGISRGAIRSAVDEVLAARFIECTQSGLASSKGQPARSSEYRLLWDEVGDYVKHPGSFRGFFAGEGHRTPIPNAFFDQILPYESLAVVKVVGAVLRHTIGYHTRFGRRPSAPLSYTFIQRYTKLGGRGNLSRAIKHALAAGYIECTKPGQVHPSHVKRYPATYAVRWLHTAPHSTSGSESEPAERFNSGTSNGSKREPVKRFKKRTKRKTDPNDTLKQQQAVVVDSTGFELLRQAGFDQAAAHDLTAKRGVPEIERQIKWLPRRNASRNPLGLLRRSIEENWGEPASSQARRAIKRVEPRQRDVDEGANHSRDQRRGLLAEWLSLPADVQQQLHERAITEANSHVARRRLAIHRDLSNPPTETLQQLLKSSPTL